MSRGPTRKTAQRPTLAGLARLAARPVRLRMIDAVALAAAGLLVLKLIALTVDGSRAGQLPAQSGLSMPDFARALAKARGDHTLPDPETTGSVTPAEPAADKAQAKGEAGKAGDGKQADGKGASSAPPSYQPPGQEAVSPTERAILEKLSGRRDSLKQRSDALDLRERMLNEAERKLEDGLGDLKQAEEKADLNGVKRAEAERNSLKNIVTMYETMKPKDAARVFDRLGLDVLVPIVLAMNPRKMAEVLALMSSEPAEKLTIALANRARGIETPPAKQAGTTLPSTELPAIDPGPPAARPAAPAR